MSLVGALLAMAIAIRCLLWAGLGAPYVAAVGLAAVVAGVMLGLVRD